MYMYVVVQFYSCFKFYFALFQTHYGAVILIPKHNIYKYFWDIIVWQGKIKPACIRTSTTSRSWRLWFVWAFLQCIWIWQQSAHTYMYSRFGKSSQLLGIQSMLFSVRILQITTLKISHTCIYNNTNRLTCGAQKFKKHFRIIKATILDKRC